MADINHVFHCELCNVISTSLINHQQHLNGAAHAKRLRLGSNSSNSGQGDRQIPCDVCQVMCTSTIDYQNHVQGESHRKKTNQIDNGATYLCDVCQVSVCGQSNYDAHLKGALHKKNSCKESVTRICELCQITVCGEVNFQMHLNGTSHRKKAEVNSRTMVRNPRVFPSTQSGSASSTGKMNYLSYDFKNLQVSSPRANPLQVESVAATTTPVQKWYCDLCNVKCDTQAVLQIHVTGLNHRRKQVMKAEELKFQQIGLISSSSAVNEEPDEDLGELICGWCKTTFTMLEPLKQHYEICTKKFINPLPVTQTAENVERADSPGSMQPSYPSTLLEAVIDKAPSYTSTSSMKPNVISKNESVPLGPSLIQNLVDGSYYCLLCEKPLYNDHMLQIHLSGLPHRRKVHSLNK